MAGSGTSPATKLRARAGLDRVVGAIVGAGRWLVLPVVGLLFAQWPLRDLVHAGSREANDLGQWLFALYVAVAVTAATRAGAHLRADSFTRRYSNETRRILGHGGFAAAVLPWSLLVLVAGWPIVRSSVAALERFPDTGNPGYFIVKMAVLLLAGLMIVQGLVDLIRPTPPDSA